jgi:hypothetical protein
VKDLKMNKICPADMAGLFPYNKNLTAFSQSELAAPSAVMLFKFLP